MDHLRLVVLILGFLFVLPLVLALLLYGGWYLVRWLKNSAPPKCACGHKESNHLNCTCGCNGRYCKICICADKKFVNWSLGKRIYTNDGGRSGK